MIETIRLNDGSEVELSSAAAFLIVYKNQYKREPLQDIMSIASSVGTEEVEGIDVMNNLDLEIVYNLAWALAKTANYKEVKDPLTFYLENPEFKPVEHLVTILNLSLGSISPDFTIDTDEEVEEEEKN